MVVITYKRKHVKIDSLGEVDYGHEPYFIKHEGVYSFGGVFGKEASVHRHTNKLFFLPIGTKTPLKWRELETQGKPAEPRYYHQMHFFERGNYLVVYGGKRLTNPEPNQHVAKSEFVSTVSLLRLDTLTWYLAKFKLGGARLDRFPDLYNFSSEMVGDRILIFGGMLGRYSQSKDLYCLKLEEKRVACDEDSRW